MKSTNPVVESVASDRKKEEFEFAGNFFLVRIEGGEGSLERASKSLTRIGITLPIEKAPAKTKKERVVIKIIFHGGEENKASKMFREWILETIIPKIEQIRANQNIKAKSNNFKDQEAETTIEISAAGKRRNETIAEYKAKI